MEDKVFQKVAELSFWDELNKLGSEEIGNLPDISKVLKDLKMPKLEKPKTPKLKLKIPNLKLPKSNIKFPNINLKMPKV